MNKPITSYFLQTVQQHGALLYTIDYPIKHSINGWDRIRLKELSEQCAPELRVEQFKYRNFDRR